MNNNNYQLYFDGGICQHPMGGYACYYGWVIKVDGTVKQTGSGFEKKEINVGSCGVELEALKRGLMDATGLGAKTLSVFGDSQTVIECINGVSTSHSEIMKQGCELAAEISTTFESISFTWIPREQNAHADHLANMAFKLSPEIKKQRSLIRQVNDLYKRVFENTLTKETRREWQYSLTGKPSLSLMTAKEIQKVMTATHEFAKENMHLNACA